MTQLCGYIFKIHSYVYTNFTLLLELSMFNLNFNYVETAAI